MDIRKISAANLSSLRRDHLHFSQEKMAAEVFDVARLTYQKWESSGTTDFEVVQRLKNYLQNHDFNRYSGFEIQDFFTRIIDFGNLSAPVIPAAMEALAGSYLMYYFDFSEVRVNELETSKHRRKVLVLYLTEKHSLLGGVELAAYGIPFKEYETALDFYRRLNRYMTERKDNAASDRASKFFAKETSGEHGENNYYEGSVDFLQDNHFQITLSNRSHRDRVSILFLSPSLDSHYVGGLGLMSSVSRGMYKRPVAQKVVLSYRELDCCMEKIDGYLSITPSDIPIDEGIHDVLNTYHTLERGQAKLHMTPEDCENFLVYRLKQVIDNYNMTLNLCGFEISTEDDNDVYHLLKHHGTVD